jgi:dTDP-4-amino-4,6-dideoxygalactose transaminase
MTTSNPILMNDFKAESPEIRAAMLVATRRVLESGWYVLGKEVQAFERQWAAICGVSCGVGVGNGMDAIEIALRAAGIGPGHEVITTSMTAFASVLAILRTGATPVLADIDLNTGLLSMPSVMRCLTINTKAVLLVHLYGQMRDMAAWQNFCKERSIDLIEDCAQAHLATWCGKVAGSFGIAGAYSFYPTKNLGAVGDAGILVCQDPAFAERAGRLRNYGQSERYYHPELGMNSRMDEIQAAMLAARLPWLTSFTDRRYEIAQAYHKGITHPKVKKLASPEERMSHVYHLYVITLPDRVALIQHLQNHGIQTFIHYPVPVHQQKSCINMRCDPSGLPACEQHAKECLSLPCHPQMTDDDVLRVIDAVNTWRN